MKFKINYDGEYKDSIIIEGEDMDELRQIAINETEKRGWDAAYCWSEKLSD